MSGKKGRSGNRIWWTRERVLLGLERLYQDIGYCPTSTEDYMRHTQYTGRDPAGRRSRAAHHQRYPSFYGVLKFFRTFREAWAAAGHDEVDRSGEEWTEMEDWFVLESVGILPRTEVAEILKRSAPAIKRRLYDLGDIRSYNRWGITLSHAASLMKLCQSVYRKYFDLGIIPYFKGCKLYYLNPADLLKVEEFDWAGDVVPELDQIVRRSVAQRVCKMLKFGAAWRDHEIYKFHKTKELYQGRIKNPRKSVLLEHVPGLASDLAVGDWVKTIGVSRAGREREVGKRFGKIETIWYSWQRVARYDGTTRGCWVARVEFPKIRTITGEKDRRIRYTIPLDYLERVDEPSPEPRSLSTHPEAIKGRKRIASGEHDRRRERIRERAAEFQGDLT